MALVSPLQIAMAMNEALIHFLSGNPKETFESPTTVFTPNVLLHHSMVLSVSSAADPSADTAMVRASTMISSFVNPN